MKITEIHDLKNIKREDYAKIQDQLAEHITLENTFSIQDIQYCAGVDVSYWEMNGEEWGVCSIVVIDYETRRPVEGVCKKGLVTFPYVSGFLAFRELPLIMDAVKKLDCSPDVFMFDGNGYLHPRHMGIATHASFFLNKPTIGIAKTYLKVHGVWFDTPKSEQFSYTDIVVEDEVYGRVLRTQRNVYPVFISPGNFMDLETAMNFVIHFTHKKSRLPIPVWLADLETKRMRRQMEKEAADKT